MFAGWAINAAVAEWIIHSRSTRTTRTTAREPLGVGQTPMKAIVQDLFGPPGLLCPGGLSRRCR
jgi:hypothetical protein